MTSRSKSGFQSSLSLTLALFLFLAPAGASPSAADDEEDRLASSATVIEEILDIPDGIPQEWLDKAECVIVLPSVKKFAIGIGGSYGRGAMVCRGGEELRGPWGAPSMVRLEGGNIGLQLGGQATDFVLLVMNVADRSLPDEFTVFRMTDFPRDFHYTGLIHLVAGYSTCRNSLWHCNIFSNKFVFSRCLRSNRPTQLLFP